MIYSNSLLSTKEYQQLIIYWNTTQADFPKDKTITQLFEAQVTKSSNAIALVFEDKQLSYQALNIQANQLAHAIQQHYQSQTGAALQADTLIGLCVERSLEMVIGILAILKAGGAYVPIDPQYPQARIEYILVDTRTPLVLTQKNVLADKPYLKKQDRQVLCLDTFDCSKFEHTNPPSFATPESLAYVIYTSGTTGQPKGVIVEQCGVNNLAGYLATTLGIKTSTRVLQFASITFDASVYEWAGTLLNQGTLIILPNEEMPPQVDLNKILRNYKINVVTLPPTILEVTSPRNLPDLHTVVTAGSTCSTQLVQRWSKTKKIFNGFGPTEGTVQCSMARLYPTATITIGKPAPNIELYVLSQSMQPTPIIVPGELYIGGVGLARGYLNQAELTQERFIDNPFVTPQDKAQGKNLKLYKTGDVVRWHL